MICKSLLKGVCVCARVPEVDAGFLSSSLFTLCIEIGSLIEHMDCKFCPVFLLNSGIVVLRNIPLQCVKMCHCERLNKELTGGKRVGETLGTEVLGKKKCRVISQT